MSEAVSSWSALIRDLDGAPVVWRDLSWRERKPVVAVEPVEDGVPCGTVLRTRLDLGDAPLVRALPVPDRVEPRWCAGFAHAEVDEQGTARFRTVACPKHQRIRSGQQCGLCRHLDRFRPLHRVHRGARLTDAALAYVSRPHWLYIATFPDASSKVGTAHERSQVTRLDQQAAARATWIALAPDGILVRRLEDAVGSELGLTQFKQVRTKHRAWAAPRPAEELDAAHDSAVRAARRLLADWGAAQGPTAGAASDSTAEAVPGGVFGEVSSGVSGAAGYAPPEVGSSLDGVELVHQAWEPSPVMARIYAALDRDTTQPLQQVKGFADQSAPEIESSGGELLGAAGPFLALSRAVGEAPALVSTSEFKHREVVLRR